MKGVVFNFLAELVEEKFGLAVWDQLIEENDLPSEGIYTATERYPDEEIFTLVTSLSTITGIPVQTLVFTFGEFLFHKLAAAFPLFVENQTSLNEFLKTIDDVIHVEVRKLHPDAALPTIQYEDSPGKLRIIYNSPRKLCHLAEGLITGAAAHFKASITLEHPVCMHEGADACHIDVLYK